MDWREATARAGGVNNPNRLWPVAVRGFDELLKRKNAQVLLVQQDCIYNITLLSIEPILPLCTCKERDMHYHNVDPQATCRANTGSLIWYLYRACIR